MSSRSKRTLYVGNLPGDIREREVEDLFYKYGPIAHIELKIPPRPPGYAFVEDLRRIVDRKSRVGQHEKRHLPWRFHPGHARFEEARDALDAIDGRDGYDFDGHRLRVELAHGGRGHSASTERHSSFSGARRGVSKHTEYRVLITGLPNSASWQDLKDHMRKAGDVCFSQVFREGGGTTGIVDYTNYEDMKNAIRKLDDTEFRNAFSRAYVRVKEYKGSPSPSRGRSRSRSRGRGRSYSRSRSPSKSPKKASRRVPARSRSRSVSSRSRSRSPVSRSPSKSRSPVPSRKKNVSKSPKKRSPSPRRSRSLSKSKSPSPVRVRSRSLSKSKSPIRGGSRSRSLSR